MKAAICRLLALLMFTMTLAGCGTIKQESAMEWMQRQPMVTDP